jgi:hypothetical protein
VTNINRKLIGALTRIAMLASATGAQASSGTLHPARHFGISPSERHFSTVHARRSSAEFQRDDRPRTDI